MYNDFYNTLMQLALGGVSSYGTFQDHIKYIDKQNCGVTSTGCVRSGQEAGTAFGVTDGHKGT